LGVKKESTRAKPKAPCYKSGGLKIAVRDGYVTLLRLNPTPDLTLKPFVSAVQSKNNIFHK